MKLLEKIYELYMIQLDNAFDNPNHKPNMVFVGIEEYLELRASSNTVVSLIYGEPTVFGLKIKRTIDEHYLAVGRVEEVEGEGVYCGKLVEENTRLKELNRELHAELKDLCDHITRPCPADVSYPSSLRDINKYHRAKIGKDKIGKARDLLARIKEEG